DFVNSAVNQTHSDIDHVVAGELTALHRVMNALFRWLDELARNCSALDLVFENETFAGSRLDLEFDVRVLAASAGLFLKDFLAGSWLRNRFAISDLRFADIRLDAEFSLHAIDDDFQVQLAHAGDNCLSGFMIGRNIERRI